MTENQQTPPDQPARKVKPVVGKLDLKTGKNETLEQILATCANLLQTKKLKAFDAEIAKAIAIAPQDPRVIHFRGLYAFETRDTVTAARLLRDALKKVPKSPTIQHNFAAVLISLGRFEQAEELLRTAIKIKPDYAEAYHTLSPIRTFTAEDPEIPQMQKGLQNPDLSDVDRSFYAFALAKALDDTKQYDAAWPVLEQGNAAMPRRYDPAGEEQSVTEIEELITKDRLQELAPYGHQSRAPVLIVGMPRSGTTLLESVIAEHPQVHAAGEMTAIGAIARSMCKNFGISEKRVGYAQAVAKTEPEHVFAAGKGYLNALKKETDAWFDHCIDKMPDNSFNLGFTAAILPNAQIIHIMRHPLDVMLSIYYQRFTSVRYGFHPDDIVSHWHSYQRAMAHWRKTLPRDMIELRYENLVQDTGFAQKLIWEKLGLTLEVDHVPHSEKLEQQRTASRFQVKQPVYQTSKEKFRRYEAHMGAFIGGMGGMDAIEAEVAAQEARCALRQAAS